MSDATPKPWRDATRPNPADSMTLMDVERFAQQHAADAAHLDRVMTRATKGGGHGYDSPATAAFNARLYAQHYNDVVNRLRATATPIERAAIWARYSPTGTFTADGVAWLIEREKFGALRGTEEGRLMYNDLVQLLS